MNNDNKCILLYIGSRSNLRTMNTVSNSLTRQILEWLNERPRTCERPLDISCTNYRHASIWENAWIDCLIQACAATPWIIVSAIGRRLLP